MSHPFIPAPNTALIEMVYTYASQIIENTFHVQKNSPFTSGDLQFLTTVFDAWDSTGTTSWHNQRSSVNVLQQIKARALDTASSPVWINVLTTPRPGLRTTGTAMPPNVTFALTWQTGHAGRSYRGRLFVPGILTGDIQASPNQGLLNSGFAGQLVITLNSLLTQINAIASDYHLVVTSYYNNHAWRTTAVNTIITNAAFADLSLDNMRRRLPGRGR